MRHVDRLLSRLRNVQPQGRGHIACCPAHDDAHPSLSITTQDDGHVRLFCRSARCSQASILNAIDLTPGDMYPDPDDEVILHSETDLIAGEPESRRNGVVPDEADLGLRDRVYRAVLYELSLTDQHRDDLRRRGVPDDEMVFRGYRSLTGPSRSAVLTALQSQFSTDELLSVPGFVRRDDGALAIVASSGMLIPVLDLLGRVIAIKVRRDVVADGDAKYSCMSGGGGPSCGTPVHVPLGITGPVSSVRVTEGELKADISTITSGLPTIGIPGVDNWPSVLPALQALGAETVRLAFDADWETKPNVARNLVECATALRTGGFDVVVERWSIGLGKGIDDLLAAGHQPEVLTGDEAIAFLTSVQNLSVPSDDPSAVEIIIELPADAPPVITSTALPTCHTASSRTDTVLPFPISIFPAPLQHFAMCAARAVGCPIDLVALPMLVMSATAIGASRAIEAKPGWWESPRMYVAVVALAGNAKSPAEKIVSRPVFSLQNRYHTEYKAALAAYKEAEAQLRPPGRRTRNSGERPAEAGPPCGETGTGEPSVPLEPQFRRILTSDATTESLAPLLMKNPRGMLMTKDELTGWIRGLNQYKGGKGADRQFYLSAWSGQAAIVDRKSQSGPIIVPHPFLNVWGGIQPDMVSVLMDEFGRADGFIDRILFSFPDPAPAHIWTDQGVDPDTERPWMDALELLFHLEMSHSTAEGIELPRIVQFTNDGKTEWVRWFNLHAAETNSSDLPSVLRGPWSKLKSYCLRLAIVVHFLRLACGEVRSEDVDADSVGRAIQAIDYFKSHARRVYSSLHCGPDDRRAEQVVAWLRRHSGVCTARDLQQSNVAGITKKSEAVKMMKDLADRGWARSKTARLPTGKKSRTSCSTQCRTASGSHPTPLFSGSIWHLMAYGNGVGCRVVMT